MAGLGPTELIIILAIVILLFGARKLPELAGSIGKSIREFRKASEDLDEDEKATDSTGDDQA